MNDTFLGRVLECPAALERDLQNIGDREKLTRSDVPGKIAPLDVLHGDVAGVFLDHSVEDRHDVRMPELSGKRSLVLELRAVHRTEFGVPEYFGLDRLERDFTPGKGILGEVHHTGRALADRLLNVVLADLKAQVHLNGRFRHALSRYAPRRLELWP